MALLKRYNIKSSRSIEYLCGDPLKGVVTTVVGKGEGNGARHSSKLNFVMAKLMTIWRYRGG